MFPREVLLRLHLDQAARRALELEFQPAPAVQLAGRGACGDHELHAAVVAFVDQRQEPARSVVGLFRQTGT
jgi:hypothetical protein